MEEVEVLPFIERPKMTPESFYICWTRDVLLWLGMFISCDIDQGVLNNLVYERKGLLQCSRIFISREKRECIRLSHKLAQIGRQSFITLFCGHLYFFVTPKGLSFMEIK